MLRIKEMPLSLPRVPEGTRFVANYDALDDADRCRLENLAFDQGRYYDSYLATEPNRHYFWARGGGGVAALLRQGKHLHVFGGLLAPPEERETLLEDLRNFAYLNGWTVGLYGVPDEELDFFRTRGFQTSKIGEEGILPLQECTWEGSNYRWLRHQVSYVKRHGIVCQEVREDETEGAAWERLLAELQDLSCHDLSRRLQKREPPGFYGRLIAGGLHRRRIFVAREPRGKILAFTVCTPSQAGQTWCPEMTRRHAAAVPGVTTFLWHQVMETLRAEGVRWFTLGWTPSLGCGVTRPGDSWLVRNLLPFVTRHFPALYNAEGVGDYKRRYRPAFRNVSVCVYPRISSAWCWSFTRLTGIFDLKPGGWRVVLSQAVRKAIKPR